MNFIRLVDKSASKQKAFSSKISILHSPFSKRKKAPIWELFFAYQDLWSQHFLHRIFHGIYGPFCVINCKFTNKNNLFSHVYTHYSQIRWVIRIFSTHRKSEKKLPYGSFFLWSMSLGNNNFEATWHMIITDQLINFNHKIIKKNN